MGGHALPARLPAGVCVCVCVQFSCPEGLEYLSASNPKGLTHSLSSFVFTDQDGGRQYGFCLQFYEPMANMPSECTPQLRLSLLSRRCCCPPSPLHASARHSSHLGT